MTPGSPIVRWATRRANARLWAPCGCRTITGPFSCAVCSRAHASHRKAAVGQGWHTPKIDGQVLAGGVIAHLPHQQARDDLHLLNRDPLARAAVSVAMLTPAMRDEVVGRDRLLSEPLRSERVGIAPRACVAVRAVDVDQHPIVR